MTPHTYIMKRSTNWAPTFLSALTTSNAQGNTCVQSMQIQLSGSVLGIGMFRYICKAIISNVCRFELQQYIWDISQRLWYTHVFFNVICDLHDLKRFVYYQPHFSNDLPTQYRSAVLPTWTLWRRSNNTALLHGWYWKIYLFFIYFYIHPIDNLQLF